MDGSSQTLSRAEKLFVELTRDSLITAADREHLVRDVSLDDWHQFTKTFSPDAQNYGMKGPFVEEIANGFLIYNHKADIEREYVLTGVYNMLKGLGLTGVGAIAGRCVPGLYGKLAGAALGAGLGWWMYQRAVEPLMELKTGPNPRLVLKNTLRS